MHERLSRLMTGVNVVIGGAAVVMIMLHSTANALLRTYFEQPISGTLEMVGYWYMPTVAFFGLQLAQRGGEHIEANLFMRRASDRQQHGYQIATNVLTIATMLAIGWFSLLQAIEHLSLGTVVGVTNVPIWPVTFAVPVGCLLYATQLVLETAWPRDETADGTAGA